MNLSKTAGYKPPFIADDTRLIGYTSDKRGVWQNEGGTPFIIVYDAKQKRHFCTVEASEIVQQCAPKSYLEVVGK